MRTYGDNAFAEVNASVRVPHKAAADEVVSPKEEPTQISNGASISTSGESGSIISTLYTSEFGGSCTER